MDLQLTPYIRDIVLSIEERLRLELERSEEENHILFAKCSKEYQIGRRALEEVELLKKDTIRLQEQSKSDHSKIERLKSENSRLSKDADLAHFTLERVEKESTRLKEQAKTDQSEIERLKNENTRLSKEADRVTAELERSKETPKLEPGLSMLGSINILDVAKLNGEEWKKLDVELQRLRDEVLTMDGVRENELSKRQRIPVAAENLCDRFDIRYDVKQGVETHTEWLGLITNTQRPNKERFLEFVHHRKWYLERPDRNAKIGGYSTYRYVFWLNVVYRLLEMRNLW